MDIQNLIRKGILKCIKKVTTRNRIKHYISYIQNKNLDITIDDFSLSELREFMTFMLNLNMIFI